MASRDLGRSSTSPAHDGACMRIFPALCAEYPRLVVGKPKEKWWTIRMPDHWFKQKTSTDMVWWSNQCTYDVWGRTERKQLCCCSSTIMIKIGCSSYFTPQFILKSDLFNVKTSTRATYLTISLIPHLMAEGPLEGLCLTPDQFLWECPKKEKLLGNAKM